MNLRRLWVALLLLAYGTWRAPAPCSPGTERKARLHEPAEIFEILEKSSIVYELDLDNNMAPQALAEPRVLSDMTYLEETADGYTLTTLALSDEGRKLLEKGLEAFGAHDHYTRKEYSRAIDYFEKAIARNFADYGAHWFLKEWFKTLGSIIEQGFAAEMIYYEMVGRKAPEALLLLPRESFTRVVEYVDKFH